MLRTNSNNINNNNKRTTSIQSQNTNNPTTSTTTTTTNSYPQRNMTPLGIYSRSVLFISIFFWCWALKNTITMESPNFDMGIISFGTTGLTSTYLLGISNYHPSSISSRWTVGFVTSSQCLVSLNYLLGTYFGIYVLDRIGFAIYCGIFSILWIGIAWIGIRLMKSPNGRRSGNDGVGEGGTNTPTQATTIMNSICPPNNGSHSLSTTENERSTLI